MKSVCYMIVAVFVFASLWVSPALAEDAPDAKVEGLWLKAGGLPEAADLEDMTQGDDEPYFIYSFGEGPDGPAVTLSIGRYPQNELAEKIFKLDKKALAEFDGAEDFTETAKDLVFIEAPAFSEKFTYPCQMATYTDSEQNLRHMILFIQTDPYMFAVNAVRSTKDMKYSDADAEQWLMNLKMVEQ